MDAEQPWTLAKQAKAGDEAAAARLRGVLGDLLEASRVLSLAAAPFMPATALRRGGSAGRGLSRTRPTATEGRRCRELAAWGGGPKGGRIGTPEPLFPRLDGSPAG